MRTLTLVSVLALAAGTAHAGNLEPAPAEPEIAPPAVAPAPVSDWTGPYSGVQLGWGWSDTTGGANLNGNGVIGGGHLGYDFDFGNLVLGAETDFDFTGISFAGNNSLDNVGRFKLRGGIDTGPALVYGTAGATYSNATLAGIGRNDWGWVAGAGMAYRVTDRFTLGGELLYHEFDNYDGTGINVDATTLTARASWRF